MVVSASFEDYLYILAGVVWLVFSFYKGKNKKKGQQEVAPKREKKSFFEGLMEELVHNDTSEPIPYTPAVEQPAEVTKDYLHERPLFSYDDEVELSNEKETSVVYKKTEVKKRKETPVIKKKVTRNQNFKLKSGFSVRKAIIYSEIINPKYF